MENLEKDMETRKMWMLEIKDSLTQIEEGRKNLDAEVQGSNSAAVAGATRETSCPQEVEKDPARFRKLEIPLFSGENPIRWLFKLECYFSVNAIEEGGKLEAALVCDKALNWYQWLEVRHPVKTWVEFKRQVLNRFNHLQVGDSYEMLMALQ